LRTIGALALPVPVVLYPWMNSKPVWSPAWQLTKSCEQTSLRVFVEFVSHPSPLVGPQMVLFEQSAITTPTCDCCVPVGIVTETGPPVHGVRLWPLRTWDDPAVRICRPSTALKVVLKFAASSFTTIAPASSGFTSSTASGSEPASVLTWKMETRACG